MLHFCFLPSSYCSLILFFNWCCSATAAAAAVVLVVIVIVVVVIVVIVATFGVVFVILESVCGCECVCASVHLRGIVKVQLCFPIMTVRDCFPGTSPWQL